ncbi:MAG: molybdopterin-dependent oxidoreductase, partial [Dehalococcoidia bacterium]|nr:molybdopterin-dependent oxidoreductase [Dehalococcoidia bacterium]
MTNERTTLIGAGLPRPDAVDKVRGDAKYVDDLAFPGMLHGWVVRSPYPHAKVMGLDPESALAKPGVACVVTHQDVPGQNVVHVIYDDQPALAQDVVRYIGEPVALVAASSRKAAKAAAEAMLVKYEELPVVSDPVEALRPESPVIVSLEEAAEGGGNVFNEMVLRKGDTDRGFSEADVIIEGEYETGYQEHAYIETQGAVAVPEENGGIAIYGSMQCPFYVQRAVSKVLGLPMSKVRVILTATGGAFGGKEDVPSQICSLAALMAWKLRRPVKLVLDRGEDVLTTSKRHPSRVRYRTGAKADGTIAAIEVDVILNAGAYQTLSSAVLWRSLCTAAGPYRIPHVRVNAKSVATNTVPNGAFRGFGSPQVIFPHEAQMDQL